VAVRESLTQFPGVEHRLEFVREVQGVQFFNNSQGTNIDAVAKSILSFDEPLHLIMGGRDKGANFGALRELVEARVKTLVLFGEASEKIKASLAGAAAMVEAASMEEAVSRAFTA